MQPCTLPPFPHSKERFSSFEQTRNVTLLGRASAMASVSHHDDSDCSEQERFARQAKTLSMKDLR